MFIKDLQARQTNVDIEGDVIELGDVREFSKYGRQGRVANAIIKDNTGTVKLSLWNEQIDKVKPGDKIKIEKGYVGEFQGELQLTTGKFGTLEVTKADEQTEESTNVDKPAVNPEQPAEKAPQPKEETKNPDSADETIDVEEEDLS